MSPASFASGNDLAGIAEEVDRITVSLPPSEWSVPLCFPDLHVPRCGFICNSHAWGLLGFSEL